jgi:glycosyltransferase involved in cell wall biosynthesis
MKIVVFAEYLPPRLGSDRRIFEIMKRLANKHEVHFVVFPPFRELRGGLIGNGYQASDSVQAREGTAELEGIKRHSISVSPRVTLLWRRLLLPAYFLTAMSVFLKSAKILKRIEPDVVVLNYPSPYTGLLGFLEARLWRKPVTVDFNDLIAQYSGALLDLKKESAMIRLLIMVQNYIAKKSDMVITPTHFIKKYAVSSGVADSNVEVISNGADTSRFESNNSEGNKLRNSLHLTGEKLCVYCGRLDGWAGTDIISKLCDIAKNRKLNVRFLLVGNGEGTKIEKENVISLGEVAYEQVPSILSVADVILIPFPNTEVSHAASPLKLFEGMSMRKPVIASRVSGIQEVVTDGQNGFLANPDDPEEWIEKLQRILDSEKLAEQVGQNAKQTVEKSFDWNILAKHYEEILNAVVVK